MSHRLVSHRLRHLLRLVRNVAFDVMVALLTDYLGEEALPQLRRARLAAEAAL